MRVLVTGAAGQLGCCLRDAIEAREAASDIVATMYERSRLDVCDASAVRRALLTCRPDVVINTAAYTSVDAAESDSRAAWRLNAWAPAMLASACTQAGARLMHLSTDYVFGSRGTPPFTEQDSPDPQSMYARTKLAGERAVLAAGARHIVIRTAWLFSEHGRNFARTMFALACRSRLAVVDDQIGCPTYAGDLAGALLHVARRAARDNAPGGVYHCCGQPATTWFGFAEAIYEQAQRAGLLTHVPRLEAVTTAQYPRPARRPPASALCTRRIEARFAIGASDWRAALPRVLSKVAASVQRGSAPQ